ncbi:Na+/H+ antiporter [Sinomonas sp. JGH33]|uniref:Na+/H+ antiporter n=1 Tax=Sinomonas terricola TaxID=3110330 RepID=A0ABU5T8F7_9MICC|nr:Na+/H+ antiporter [Sinomonas sp. JGH33]MEA5455802.1 Na+/H+ antiporter [Sinomonas sp. JGH33]
MLGLELVVALGAAVILGSIVAERIRANAPVILLVAGVLLSFVPAFGNVGLPPETVLLLFLPALLYWESLTTSLRTIRTYIRGVMLSATLLVFATASAIAVVAHAFGLDWGAAWILGAAVAPTDATAVSALGRGLARRQIATLRAESLMNDGMALVIYGVALSSALAGTPPDTLQVSAQFVYSFGGGVLVGLAVGWILLEARRRISNPLFGNAGALLIPFVAFLGAELIHASAVLAVVACGLYVAHASPLAISAYTRQQTSAVWTLVTFLLNGALFVLVGLQLPSVIEGLTTFAFGQAIAIGAAVFVTGIAARFAFLVSSAYIIRAIDRRPYQRSLRTTNRARLVSAFAGFRGAVSLAVALSVPIGAAIPARDTIVFVTAFVVVASLVVQGMALPHVIRWARIPVDTSAAEELALARRTASEEAFAAMPGIARELGIEDDVLDRIRAEYEEHLSAMNAGDDGDGDNPAVVRSRQYTELRLALIARKRAVVVRLRDTRAIDDTVLRQIQSQLDLEEVRLVRPQQAE